MVTAIATSGLILAVVALTVASTSVESGLQLPGFPSREIQATLFTAEREGGESGALTYFNVSGPMDSTGPTEVGFAVVVNVTCGGPTPYLIGVEFQCAIGLLSFPGTPDEALLWSTHFNGSSVTTVVSIPPGSYALIIGVAGGSPPGVVIEVPFSWLAEGVILNPTSTASS